MNSRDRIRLAATLMVTMFVVSGAMKVRSFGASEALRLAKRTRLHESTAARIVFVAGVIELVGAFLVLKGVWSPRPSHRDAELGALILASFTVLATLIFYVSPLRPYPLLSNMTVLSGLILLPMACELRQ